MGNGTNTDYGHHVQKLLTPLHARIAELEKENKEMRSQLQAISAYRP